MSDTHTKADIIAHLDNDSVFTSVVTLSDLFDADMRPVAIGHQTPDDVPTERFTEATKLALGRRQIADFMSNFPILIKRELLPRVRSFLAERFNRSVFCPYVVCTCSFMRRMHGDRPFGFAYVTFGAHPFWNFVKCGLQA